MSDQKHCDKWYTIVSGYKYIFENTQSQRILKGQKVLNTKVKVNSNTWNKTSVTHNHMWKQNKRYIYKGWMMFYLYFVNDK